MIRIAGEGSGEIGPRRAVAFGEGGRPSGGGVIEALMAKVRPSGWSIRDAMIWKDVRKLRVNSHGDGEAKTVAGLALQARELGCNALVFLRDRDRSVSRERAIRDAIESAPAKRVTAMVELVRNSGPLAVPSDATSLRQWLRSVALALSVRIPDRDWPSP
jgi:hypothetical protein